MIIKELKSCSRLLSNIAFFGFVFIISLVTKDQLNSCDFTKLTKAYTTRAAAAIYDEKIKAILSFVIVWPGPLNKDIFGVVVSNELDLELRL